MLLGQTKNKVEALHNNQWIGQCADKFFDEMESVVLPKMGKLLTALDVAGHVANQIIQTIHQADEETRGFFGDQGTNAQEPPLIARYRPVAYQYVVVMKYIDNLIGWGDQVFQQDTIEDE